LRTTESVLGQGEFCRRSCHFSTLHFTEKTFLFTEDERSAVISLLVWDKSLIHQRICLSHKAWAVIFPSS